ncbi:hypothetical protein V513_03120 [Mesotoga sp. H07.pep.5.3]|nr:hypothetical protein V513_03120 [Mesotoga sp. H07.pep.5.3]
MWIDNEDRTFIPLLLLRNQLNGIRLEGTKRVYESFPYLGPLQWATGVIIFCNPDKEKKNSYENQYKPNFSKNTFVEIQADLLVKLASFLCFGHSNRMSRKGGSPKDSMVVALN